MQKRKLALLVLLAAYLFGATVQKSFTSDWATGWGTAVESGSCVTSTCTQDTAVGNPLNSGRCDCGTASSTIVRHHEWTGTWETLGVPAGATVSTLQMLDADTMSDWKNATLCSYPGIELRNSSNGLEATIWGGRTPAGDETVWTAEGSDPAQSVGTLTASNSNIELWVRSNLQVGAGAGADYCKNFMDNLDLEIVYTGGTVVNRFLIALSLRPTKTRLRAMFRNVP